MEQDKNVRDAVNELLNNLGTIGQFMLSETRSMLQKGWGGSREEFFDAVNRTAKSMKQSGKWAYEDVERAANQIKSNWELIDKEDKEEWQKFSDELGKRLKSITELTQEAFDLSVEQAKKTLDAQWTAAGRIGEEQFKSFQKRSDEMAQAFRKQWNVFYDEMDKTGKKVDKAWQAAWKAFKGED